MCYDVIACPTCGEWLDEFNASTHECKQQPLTIPKKETVIEEEKPIELLVPAKKRLRN